MKIDITYRDENNESHTVPLHLNMKCNQDKAKRLADDLYFVCRDVLNVKVIDDDDNKIYQTL